MEIEIFTPTQILQMKVSRFMYCNLFTYANVSM